MAEYTPEPLLIFSSEEDFDSLDVKIKIHDDRRTVWYAEKISKLRINRSEHARVIVAGTDYVMRYLWE